MKIPGFRSGNWGLKLLSLVLAVVIYYTIRNGSARHGGHTYERTSTASQAK